MLVLPVPAKVRPPEKLFDALLSTSVPDDVTCSALAVAVIGPLSFIVPPALIVCSVPAGDAVKMSGTLISSETVVAELIADPVVVPLELSVIVLPLVAVRLYP